VTNQMIQRLKSVEDNVTALRDEGALSGGNTIGGDDDEVAVPLATNIPFIDFDPFPREVINRGYPKASGVPPDMPSFVLRPEVFDSLSDKQATDYGKFPTEIQRDREREDVRRTVPVVRRKSEGQSCQLLQHFPCLERVGV